MMRALIIIAGAIVGTALMFLPLGAIAFFHLGAGRPDDLGFLFLMSLSVGAPGGLAVAASIADAVEG